MFATRIALLVLCSLSVATAGRYKRSYTKKKGSVYVANLGKYGSFKLTIDGDDSKMDWSTSLKNLDELRDLTGIDYVDGNMINYHLHTFWSSEYDFELGAAEGVNNCGGMFTGGHYDPYFGCGPASAASDAQCVGVGNPKPKDGGSYTCSGAYQIKEYDMCEVGDLSGKDGPLKIKYNKARKTFSNDPLPALDYHYVDPGVENNPKTFGAVVFHGEGGARFLCGKLELVEY